MRIRELSEHYPFRLYPRTGYPSGFPPWPVLISASLARYLLDESDKAAVVLEDVRASVAGVRVKEGLIKRVEEAE